MRLVKWSATFVGLVALFMAYRVFALTREGSMLWFVLDRSAVLVENGKPVSGWLHREWKGRALIFTRSSRPAGRSSYLVTSGRRGTFVEGCNGWTAMRSPVLPFPVFVSDALPCPGWVGGEHPSTTPFFGQAILKDNDVEFADERGRRLEARWR
jgi:hypothetical protein